MQQVTSECPVKSILLDALAPISNSSLPLHVRTLAIVMELLVTVPVDDPDEARALARRRKSQIDEIIDVARQATPRSAVHCSIEQSMVIHLQERCAVPLGVDTSRWRGSRWSSVPGGSDLPNHILPELAEQLFYNLLRIRSGSKIDGAGGASGQSTPSLA
jgi:hypothetical protein